MPELTCMNVYIFYNDNNYRPNRKWSRGSWVCNEYVTVVQLSLSGWWYVWIGIEWVLYCVVFIPWPWHHLGKLTACFEGGSKKTEESQKSRKCQNHLWMHEKSFHMHHSFKLMILWSRQVEFINYFLPYVFTVQQYTYYKWWHDNSWFSG